MTEKIKIYSDENKKENIGTLIKGTRVNVYDTKKITKKIKNKQGKEIDITIIMKRITYKDVNKIKVAWIEDGYLAPTLNEAVDQRFKNLDFSEKVKKEYKDKVIIKTVDVRKQQAFASQFPIRVTPTLFYFNADGTPYKASDELAKKISYVAYEDKKSGELKFGGSEGVVKYEELKQVIEEMLKNVK